MGGDLLGYLTTFGLGAVVLEIVRSAFQRRKMGADTAEVISRSALALLAPLEKRIEDLTHELEEARTELATTRQELGEAREEIRTLRVDAGFMRDANDAERRSIADRAERRDVAERAERRTAQNRADEKG